MKLILALIASTLLLGTGARAQDAFPTSKTVTLKEDGRTWWIDERAEIASTVSIVNLRATKIEGRAKDGKENVLFVSGSLELKAVTGGKVLLENVWIELAPDAKSLYLSHCEFIGGGVRSQGKLSTAAKIFTEITTFGKDSSCSLAMHAGSVDMQATHSNAPVVFTGIALSEKSPNRTNLSILTCNGEQRGLLGGLQVSGMADVQVRHTVLGGASTRIVDCPKLDFDGNNVQSVNLQFVQTVYGNFGATKIHNCDFRSDKIEFRTPAPEKKLEKVILDHCWFRGLTEAEKIGALMVIDHANDATTGVTIGYAKISPSALGLAGHE
ncbi:MAG TPA: hypothetical protein VK843_13895 [Planctomycetota bacterium]|nr:hypothetical protein [Planctomycetota bacterium]